MEMFIQKNDDTGLYVLYLENSRYDYETKDTIDFNDPIFSANTLQEIEAYCNLREKGVYVYQHDEKPE